MNMACNKFKMAILIALLVSTTFMVNSFSSILKLNRMSKIRISQSKIVNTKSDGFNFPSVPHSMPTNLKASSASIPAQKEAPEKLSKTFKKILPLGAMLFFILFNYTILRDTKDVLVVTAPGGGAEIIPFLKTYVNLPSSIGFAVLYGVLCNKMSTDSVFYLVMSSFIAFFGAFAGIIYPNRMLLHPNAAADWLVTKLPQFFLPVIAIFRNWTYALFYTLANMWYVSFTNIL